MTKPKPWKDLSREEKLALLREYRDRFVPIVMDQAIDNGITDFAGFLAFWNDLGLAMKREFKSVGTPFATMLTTPAEPDEDLAATILTENDLESAFANRVAERTKQ